MAVFRLLQLGTRDTASADLKVDDVTSATKLFRELLRSQKKVLIESAAIVL